MIDPTKPPVETSRIELVSGMEFVCWFVVVLAPLLRHANGPAATNDQWWIQVFLFCLALAGACGLRVYRLLVHRA